MMSTQLGRILLGTSASTQDAISAKPDRDRRYGLLDELLEEVAAQALAKSRLRKNRQPGRQSPADRPVPLNQPSGGSSRSRPC